MVSSPVSRLRRPERTERRLVFADGMDWPKLLSLNRQASENPFEEQRPMTVAGALERVVQAHPGLSVREAVKQVRQDVPMNNNVIVCALHDLTQRGTIQRRAWGRRHCLFPTAPDLETWWVQIATLREGSLRLLYGLIRENHRWTVTRLCREASSRHDWPPSTTKSRLRRLLEADLVALDRPGVRYATLQACRLHPTAQEVFEALRGH